MARRMFLSTFFRGQAVPLVHGKEEERQHQGDHQEHGPGASNGGPGQQIGRDADDSRRAEAHKLPFRQIKGEFRLDAGQVVGYVYIGQKEIPPS